MEHQQSTVLVHAVPVFTACQVLVDQIQMLTTQILPELVRKTAFVLRVTTVLKEPVPRSRALSAPTMNNCKLYQIMIVYPVQQENTALMILWMMSLWLKTAKKGLFAQAVPPSTPQQTV